MDIMNEQLDKTSKTYKTYDGAVKAANDKCLSWGGHFGNVVVIIAAVGNRYAPMFILTQSQLVLAVSIAASGFMAIRP